VHEAQQFELGERARAVRPSPDIAIGADPGHQAAAPVTAQHRLAELALHEPGRLTAALRNGNRPQPVRAGVEQKRPCLLYALRIVAHGAVRETKGACLDAIAHTASLRDTSGGVPSTPASAMRPPARAASMPAHTPMAQGHHDRPNEKSNTSRASSQATATAADAASRPARPPSSSS